jgi:glycosyltransferase involved in cell wall biosynthesis
MKIAYLTAGAAGMICGSCLHDNTLAKALIRLGHECILIPVYTPIRTDEEDVSIDRVFMGGINVYLQQKIPWLAYLPDWMDGFLNHPALIAPLTKNAGKTSPQLLGSLSVSMLQGTAGRQRKEFRRLLEWLNRDIQPDLLVFTNLLIGGFIPEIKKAGGPRVIVTLQGDDIFLDSLPPKYREQAIDRMRVIVPSVDRFLVHSQDYADRMSKLLAIPMGKIEVLPLGIDVSDFRRLQPEPRSQSSFCLGYFARMAPEKGLNRLVDAFIRIANHPDAHNVHLKMAGWMGSQHTEFWDLQKQKLAAAGLNHRWEFAGSIDRNDKAKFLSSLDLFCVPTSYAEPKGLFLLEAIAAGVPYVQPNHGAFPELHRRLQSLELTRPLGRLFEADSEDDLCHQLLNSIRENHRIATVDPKVLDEIDIERHARRALDIFEQTIASNR